MLYGTASFYFLSLSLNFDFNLPKNPLDRLDFLSVTAELEDTTPLPAEDVVGAELAPTPLVTAGRLCAFKGFDMGEMSRESGCSATACFVAFLAAGGSAGAAAVVTGAMSLAGVGGGFSDEVGAGACEHWKSAISKTPNFHRQRVERLSALQIIDHTYSFC